MAYINLLTVELSVIEEQKDGTTYIPSFSRADSWRVGFDRNGRYNGRCGIFRAEKTLAAGETVVV